MDYTNNTKQEIIGVIGDGSMCISKVFRAIGLVNLSKHREDAFILSTEDIQFLKDNVLGVKFIRMTTVTTTEEDVVL